MKTTSTFDHGSSRDLTLSDYYKGESYETHKNQAGAEFKVHVHMGITLLAPHSSGSILSITGQTGQDKKQMNLPLSFL